MSFTQFQMNIWWKFHHKMIPSYFRERKGKEKLPNDWESWMKGNKNDGRVKLQSYLNAWSYLPQFKYAHIHIELSEFTINWKTMWSMCAVVKCFSNVHINIHIKCKIRYFFSPKKFRVLKLCNAFSFSFIFLLFVCCVFIHSARLVPIRAQ